MDVLEALVPVTDWTCEYNVQVANVRVDAKLTVCIAGHLHEFAVETKKRLDAPHVGPIAHRARLLANKDIRTVVCAARIPGARGHELREAGIGYIDCGGNAYLAGGGLHIFIDGRPPVVEEAKGGLRGTEARLLVSSSATMTLARSSSKSLRTEQASRLERLVVHARGLKNYMSSRGWDADVGVSPTRRKA